MGGDISRKEIERYKQFVGKLGLLDLIWMKRKSDGLHSSVVKFFSCAMQRELEQMLNIETGDLVLFAAESEVIVNQSFDHLRRLIARERQLIKKEFSFLWVTDFPLFEWNANEGRYKSVHHPFTSPHLEDLAFFDKDPLKMRAYAYDFIINGYEVGGGSQRIHDFEIQKKVFDTLNFDEEEINRKFGFFIEALQYGTPPHLGIALGFDRIIMILTKTENIRDVIAFPKTQKASDLMMRSPSGVSSVQLDELRIQKEQKK